ncbi:MAG: S8 family serine peptidase, partial [Maribacter sp.]|nr:S8 family serine peptidase [Maribacter sp.]
MKGKNKEKEEVGVVIPSPGDGEQIIVRFKRDSGIRFTDSKFVSATGSNVGSLKDLLEEHPNIEVRRLFEQTEDALEREVASLAASSGTEVPPLSGYYGITAKDLKQAKSICATLEKLPLVDEVYIEPPALPALFDEPLAIVSDESPPDTPDFTSMQGYLKAAPEGVDAFYSWTLSGGKGDKAQVIDIEGAWNFSHEDLLQNQGGVVGGTPTSNLSWENHGTAVQGEISGDTNQIGIKGIAPDAKFSAVSIFGVGNSSSKAIKTAADKLGKGDIILIELHRPGPNATGSGQFGYIPIEWWSADFDAVKYATSKGVIVIAAAGNGSQNLDDSVYQGKFNRNSRDSGAIIIGAGAPPSGNYGPDRSRLSFSNYGAIVDAQGWGREVTSTGYGNLQGGSDKNKWYTKFFSGTSSASPIVVGAVACLQSIQKTRGGLPLSFTQLRDVLRTTGSPQSEATGRPKTQRIGNRPDLEKAISLLKPQTKISSGIATKYWLELLAYPPGSARSLWLLVNNSWKSLDNPNASTSDVVQRAF